jgi:hypothetical protein
MRATKILILLVCAVGLAAALAPAAEAQSFLGEYCWTVQPANNPPALARFGVTNQGGPYYILQGYVTGAPTGVPLFFGSGIMNGGKLYLSFTMTMDEGFWQNASQMRGEMDGTTLNGSMWELGTNYDGQSPTPFYPYFDGLTMTYNPTCTQP